MNVQNDPYTLLGISVDATEEDVKTAYRRIARRLHPDKNHHQGANHQFKEITDAYELLLDINRRRGYDSANGAREDKQPYNFTTRVTPSKRSMRPMDEDQVCYLLIEIVPSDLARLEHAEVLAESRLNLTLVIDRSRSMAEDGWLDRVKVSAHHIIDQLNEQDFISIVTFNDFAEVVVEAAPVKEKAQLKARISMMTAGGSTSISKGLEVGLEQNHKYLGDRLINHIVLLTDGQSYGDNDVSLTLAQAAIRDGITISAMGLGKDWNDRFLDQLATTTGGVSTFVRSSTQVARFLNEHVRSLSQAFAERMMLSIAPDPDIEIERAFKLAPSPQPVDYHDAVIPLGGLPLNRMISVLFQLGIPPLTDEGFRPLARVMVEGDILSNTLQRYQTVTDVSIGVSNSTYTEEPPAAMAEALGKLSLYQQQERVHEAIAIGDIPTATRRLNTLALRLEENGDHELAQQARLEAQVVQQTSNLSELGRKTLKYHTRALMLPAGLPAQPE